MTRKKFLLKKKFQNAKQKFWRFDIDWNSGPVRQRLVSIAFQSSDNDWAVSELDWPQCRKIASYFYDFALIINQPGADSATVAQVPPPRSTFLARTQRCGRATSWTDLNRSVAMVFWLPHHWEVVGSDTYYFVTGAALIGLVSSLWGIALHGYPLEMKSL